MSGISQLSALTFEVSDLAAWEAFATGVLGVDVGAALDRALRAGCRIINVLGRHPNDRMLSFYAETPSGFQFEFGCGGRLVDDGDWTIETYDRISDWGHTPPPFLSGRRRKP